jgi:hypothetical protein
MSDGKTTKANPSVNVGETGKTHQVSLDTPQQDSDWSEKKKLEWIKRSSANLLKVFNQA